LKYLSLSELSISQKDLNALNLQLELNNKSNLEFLDLSKANISPLRSSDKKEHIKIIGSI